MTTDSTPIGREIDGPGRQYFEHVVVDNVLEALVELTAAVWTYHDRVIVLEGVLDKLVGSGAAGKGIAALIEEYQPSPAEQARRQAERDELVANVFRSFARRPIDAPTTPGERK